MDRAGKAEAIKSLEGVIADSGSVIVARYTGLSVAEMTEFRSKLREQGVTYTQLVEDTRRDLSLQYVRDPNYSFNEVAFLLGFTEPANFSRAFKRWYGRSPSEFRRQSLS